MLLRDMFCKRAVACVQIIEPSRYAVSISPAFDIRERVHDQLSYFLERGASVQQMMVMTF